MKTSPTKTKASASHKITKPTRTSSRIAAKNSVALKMEKNTRQDKPVAAKKNTRTRSPRSPTKNSKKNLDKVLIQMKEDEDYKNKVYELNESLRDNALTSRNNQNTFKLNQEEFDSFKCQMHFEDLNIDFYPSAIRAIENSDNDLAVRALHNIEKLHIYRHY